MTPKEKAKELVEKFYNSQIQNLNKQGLTEFEEIELKIAEQSALIAVDGILDLGLLITDSNKLFVNCDESQCLSYWLQVKIELERL